MRDELVACVMSLLWTSLKVALPMKLVELSNNRSLSNRNRAPCRYSTLSGPTTYNSMRRVKLNL